MPARFARLQLVLAALILAAVLLPAVAAQARGQCIADASDDLLDLVTGNTTASNARADLQAMCVDHRPGSLRLQARLGAHTDIAAYPAWLEGQSALVFQVDINPDPADPNDQRAQHDYDVVIGRAGGVAAYSVLRVADGTVVCGSSLPEESLPTSSFPAITLTLPTASCLPALDGAPGADGAPTPRAPDVVRVGAFIIFTEQGANSTLDEMPSQTERFAMALGTEPRPPVVGVPGVIRLGGATRIQTAIAASQQAFPAANSARAVVLATGQPLGAGGQPATSSPDALSAAPLATHVGGPLLLLGSAGEPGQLADEVLAEISRVGVDGATVYLVGGTAVIHPQVVADLAEAGFVPIRLAGDTRESTSLAVARAIDPEPTRIVLADGSRFEFALLGGAYAAYPNARFVGPDGQEPAGRAVLLLTTVGADGRPALHPSYSDYLQTDRPGREFVAVGQVAADAARRGGLDIPDENLVIVEGDDVFLTALALADRYTDQSAQAGALLAQEQPSGEPSAEPLPRIAAPGTPSTVVVASGLNFPDAISGGALAGRFAAPLLFSWPDSLPGAVRDHLRIRPERLNPAFVMGGPAALEDAVAFQLSVCGVQPAGNSTSECRQAR